MVVLRVSLGHTISEFSRSGASSRAGIHLVLARTDHS
jgi:hypothetical protein